MKHVTQQTERDNYFRREKHPALLVDPGCVRLNQLRGEDWKRELSDFLSIHGRARLRDFNKKASEATLKARRDIIFATVTVLEEAGKLKTLSQFTTKHIPFLFEHWDRKGISKRTQNNYFCILKWFWKTCGVRAGAIGGFAKYKGEFTVNRNAEHDKSWAGAGVNFQDILQQVEEEDPVAANILRAIKVFGLRPKEAVCLRPHESDCGSALEVLRGSKTGRARRIEFKDLDEIACREVLDKLKLSVETEMHLGWKDRTLKQSMERIYTLTKKHGLRKSGTHGVTLYGLRHQFAHDMYESLTGANVPVHGGVALNYRAIKPGAQRTSSALGHHRLDVLGAYIGSARSTEGRQRRNMLRAWERLEPVLNGDLAVLLKELDVDNLFWIGELSLGGPNINGTYELVIPGEVDSSAALALIGKIEDMVIAGTGMQCTVQYWPAMAQIKQVLWADQAIPLYLALSPLGCMKELLAEQTKARLSSVKRAFGLASCQRQSSHVDNTGDLSSSV